MFGAIRHTLENFYTIKAGVKELSMILATMGFPIAHLNDPKTDSYPFPWIEIRASAPENWENDLEQRAFWTEKNLNNKKKMAEYLSIFYRNRSVPYDRVLAIKTIGRFEGFILHNLGMDQFQDDPKQLELKRKEYSKEFLAFYRFLEKNMAI